MIYEFGLEFNVDYDYDIENLINIVILKINMGESQLMDLRGFPTSYLQV